MNTFTLLFLSALLVCASGRFARRSGLECEVCTTTLALVDSYLNHTSLESMVHSLDAACDKTFRNGTSLDKDCRKLAFLAAEGLRALPKLVTTGSGYPNNVACAILLGACQLPCCSSPRTPEQLSVTLTSRSDTIRVTWITLQNTASSVVQWGTSSTQLTQSASGNTTTYTTGGWLGVIHRAYITGLTEGQRYYYRVGDGASNWSPIATFVSPSTAYPMRVAVVGDMGIGPQGQSTMDKLSQLVDGSSVDWLLHSGDISYADGNQLIWDEYGRQIASLASRLPYVTVPGNHEFVFDFAAYRHRYPMDMSPGPLGQSLYWSLDRGRVHFIGLNSESPMDTPLITQEQLTWLTTDLKAAAARKRNGQLDWIVITLHRALYCSSSMSATFCTDSALYMRVTLEPLFQTYLVDLVIQAHCHNYERTTPVFNNVVMSGGKAPVYLVNGIGGSRERDSGNFDRAGPNWRVTGYSHQPHNATQDLYGYGMLTVTSNQMRFQIISNVEGVFDDFYVTKRVF